MQSIHELNDEKLSSFDYEDFIGVPLEKNDKKILCELLDLRGLDNKVLQWKSVKKLLDDYYLKVVDKTIRIDGKHKRVTFIIDELENKKEIV